jgi:FixJ family two-component response regulator
MRADAHPSPILVSIVDDDASVRRALRRMVESAGFAVATFGSGSEVLEGELSGAAACLVMDVYLGDMTGFEVQRHLAARGIDLPTIFITAHDDAVTTERARQARAAAYLLKPVEGDVLVDAISAALAGRRG